ncbi:MAG: DUF4331 family protein [Chitinophagaceae bacterium]|nr:DUF4331 family protein [Chitinophagaceae bacterium]
MKNFKIKTIRAVLSAMAMLFTFSVSASSHREAPLISNDPLADNADVYAFRSPNDTNKVTLIATYVPMQAAHGGPNYYSFGEHVRYEIHVENNGIAGDDITYRFTFTKVNQDPTTFFNIRLGAQNLKTTYTLERSINGGAFTVIIANGIVPPPNIGARSIETGVGLGTNYPALFNNAISTAATGEQVFCGSADDPFFVDLGGVFDLGDLPRQSGGPKDGLKYLNVSVIAIQVDISTLQKNGQGVATANNILDGDFVIGVWASASRQQMKTINADGTEMHSGPWVQVSRLGMPLTNEAVIPIGDKDKWNSLTPYNEDPAMEAYFCNPELGLYMDDALFGGAVPSFAPLRIQRNSLQTFDFGNTHDGLWPLRATNAGAGTALDTMLFGNYLLRQGQPRSVDLLPIFHTGVPNLAPYQLATGKGGNPLAVGKPFINNFLPLFGDMLRLNMAVPVTPRNHPQFSSMGLVQAAVLGLTTAPYNANANLEWIPNMDGFPNGRRLEDDVTRIELQAVGGVVLAAIGLWYDDYTAGGPNPVTQDLVDVLSYNTGISANDTTFRTTFPFVQMPWRGTGEGGGLATPFTQAVCLNTATPLPLHLLSFDVFKQYSNALLDWKTANKENVKGFQVQRSTNGSDFVNVTFVSATEKDDYSFTDPSLENGKYYYRLKVMDNDNRFFYSEVRTVIFSETNAFELYPNPVSDEMKITSAADQFSYSIYTADGKVIESGNVHSNSKTLSMKHVVKGVYYIKMNTNTETKTIKFLKQ